MKMRAGVAMAEEIWFFGSRPEKKISSAVGPAGFKHNSR
jgi:hypothetical protein